MSSRLFVGLIFTICFGNFITGSYGLELCNGGAGQYNLSIDAARPVEIKKSATSHYEDFSCRWLITAPRGGVVAVNITSISMGGKDTFRCTDGSSVESIFQFKNLTTTWLAPAYFEATEVLCILEIGYTDPAYTPHGGIDLLLSYNQGEKVSYFSSGGSFYLSESRPSVNITSTNAIDVPRADVSLVWMVHSPPDTSIKFEFKSIDTGTDVQFIVTDSGFNNIAVVSGVGLVLDPITVDGNVSYMKIWFKYSMNPSNRIAVTVSYTDLLAWNSTTVLSSCGATIAFTESSPEIQISTPKYNPSLSTTSDRDEPSIYYILCTWYFLPPTNSMTTIKIDIQDFQMDNYYLEVIDGNAYDVGGNKTTVSSLIGDLALQQMPTYTSRTRYSSLNLVSKNGGDIGGRGMKARVKVTPQGVSGPINSCGGFVRLDDSTTSQVITQPEFLSDNFAQSSGVISCFWSVEGPSDVLLQYVNFELDNATFYRIDPFGILSFDPASWNYYSKISGTTQPNQFSFRKMELAVVVSFPSISSVNLQLDTALITEETSSVANPEISCGGHYDLAVGSQSSVIFAWPGEGRTVEEDAYYDCHWLFQNDPDRVELQFQDFSVGEGNYVSVYDNLQSLQYWTGDDKLLFRISDNTLPKPVTSAGSTLLVGIEYTSGSRSSTGISATATMAQNEPDWDSSTWLESCGGRLVFSGDPQRTTATITTPHYSTTSTTQYGYFDCRWFLSVTGEVYLNRINFTDLGTDTHTFLKVYDGQLFDSNHHFATVSGSIAPQWTPSTTNTYVFQYLDQSWTDRNRGASATVAMTSIRYDSSRVISCGTRRSLDIWYPSHEVLTPNYRSSSTGNYLDCTWYFDIKQDFTLQLKVADSSLDGDSHFYVYDGRSMNSQVILDLTGQDQPTSVNTSANAVTLRYISQRNSTSTGLNVYVDVNADANKCRSQPCQNSGSCSDRWNDFYCICADGYRGHLCELDACTSYPCLHNGTCIFTPPNYQCQCTSRYEGSNCELTKSQNGKGVIIGVLVFLAIIIIIIVVVVVVVVFVRKRRNMSHVRL